MINFTISIFIFPFHYFDANHLNKSPLPSLSDWLTDWLTDRLKQSLTPSTLPSGCHIIMILNVHQTTRSAGLSSTSPDVWKCEMVFTLSLAAPRGANGFVLWNTGEYIRNIKRRICTYSSNIVSPITQTI